MSAKVFRLPLRQCRDLGSLLAVIVISLETLVIAFLLCLLPQPKGGYSPPRRISAFPLENISHVTFLIYFYYGVWNASPTGVITV
uniref:Putative secreted protein n=1 Tax=Ixodes ricinus TaxID=34613 RepID=A0A6B0TXU8_IXORI